MIELNKIEKEKLFRYFSKKSYDTRKLLEQEKYNDVHVDIKNFLEDLTFEDNGVLKKDVLFSSQDKNEEVIESFFEYLENSFSAGSREIFINTVKEDGSIPCDYTSSNRDEQVRCIKKFLLEKYEKMYKNMRNTWGKYLIEQSNLHICPYCYRSYIGVVESKDGSKAITPDLDHFYPKSRYPFLSVTLSNLVPSCLFCNQRAKNDVDFYKNSIYPPSKIFDEIEFDFDMYLNKIYIKNYSHLIANPKLKTHLDTFLIQEIYASHTEVLKTIVNKVRKYRKSKIEDIASYTIGLTKAEIQKIVFYEYEYMNKKKELLYKLKKDLYESIKETSL